MTSPVHHALREAKSPAHEGARFRLMVDVGGKAYIGEVVECDTEVVALSTDSFVIYISHAHIATAMIMWL